MIGFRTCFCAICIEQCSQRTYVLVILHNKWTILRDFLCNLILNFSVKIKCRYKPQDIVVEHMFDTRYSGRTYVRLIERMFEWRVALVEQVFGYKLTYGEQVFGYKLTYE